MKDKPHRWGFKIWCLVSDGYLQRFSVYLGKRGQERSETPSEALIRLVTPYYGMNHLVVMNNLFCSPALCQTLLQNSTFALGTVQTKRVGFPSSLVVESSNLSHGQWSFRQNERMVAYVFVDRKPVYFLSTYYYPFQLDTLERRGKKGENLVFKVPKAVTVYNSTRCGVDTLDQFQSYYPIGRKNRRWWPRLAWWLFDMCIINAHRLYEIKNKEKISSRDFHIKLMHELAGDFHSSFVNSNIQSSIINCHKESKHQLGHSPTQSNCYICWSDNGMRKQTHFKCLSCNKFICAIPCYDIHRNVEVV
jgi:Transposase IS4/DDE_Tnp_1-like zinc-ribbon